VIDYLYIQYSRIVQVNLDCLQYLPILGVQEDQLVLARRVLLVPQWVLSRQWTQLQSHIANTASTMQTYIRQSVTKTYQHSTILFVYKLNSLNAVS